MTGPPMGSTIAEFTDSCSPIFLLCVDGGRVVVVVERVSVEGYYRDYRVCSSKSGLED